MVRQKSRKSLEEVYGTKFETSKSQVNGAKSTSAAQNMRDYGYIITASTPYNANNPRIMPSVNNSGAVATSAANTARRQNVRYLGKPGGATNAHKYDGKEEKVDSASKAHNSMAMKTTREVVREGSVPLEASRQYDSKTYRPYSEANKDIHMAAEDNGGFKHCHQHYHNSSHNNHPDEDKDDDTEEFFQLIRQTVENAIRKPISELFNRNFRELGNKLDRFSLELKNMNQQLNKVQVDLNNKIVHYGEENSRHFRYLCMKSEYDKMFYQHQSMMSAAVAVPPTNSDNQQMPSDEVLKAKVSSTKPNLQKDDNKSVPCTCRNSTQPQPNTLEAKNPCKSSSDEQNISRKSSDVEMRHFLERIQRACTEMHINEMRGGNRPSSSRRLKSVRAGEDSVIKINKKIFEDDGDEDDLDMSSNESTPRCNPFGGMTTRNDNADGGGGGDGF